jgi:hypothetical protein
MRPGCEPARGWSLFDRGNQRICGRQNLWTRSGTGVFLGLKLSQGSQLSTVAQAFIHMGDWCGSVRRIRHLTRGNDGRANGTTPNRSGRPGCFSARSFRRGSRAALQSWRWRVTLRIQQPSIPGRTDGKTAMPHLSHSARSPETSSLSQKCSRRLRRSVF